MFQIKASRRWVRDIEITTMITNMYNIQESEFRRVGGWLGCYKGCKYLFYFYCVILLWVCQGDVNWIKYEMDC